MTRRRPMAALAGLAFLPGLIQTAPVLAAGEQAGVAAAVRGQVQIAARAGTVGKQVQSGEPVFLGDAIATGPNAGLQIILLDETTFTIGPNSQLTIDEFVYDPRGGAGKVTASVTKGVFRFVTGRVAKEQPSAMVVKLPTGTIGIRGTITLGRVDQLMQGNQPLDREQVVLVGPGANTEGGNKPGGLNLGAGNRNTEITRPGYGSTLLGRGGQWGSPQYFDPAMMGELLGALRVRGVVAAQQGQQGGPSGKSTANAGQSTYVSRTSANNQAALNRSQAYADFIQGEQSQPTRDKRDTFTTANAVDGQSSFGQLRLVNKGQFFWSQANVPMSGITNTYSVLYNIDFGNRSAGGGNSKVTVNNGTLPAGVIPLGASSYANLLGPAQFNYLNTTAINSGTYCGGNCTIRFTAKPFNQDGVIANNLNHTLTIRNQADTAAVGSGSGTAVGRSSGLAP